MLVTDIIHQDQNFWNDPRTSHNGPNAQDLDVYRPCRHIQQNFRSNICLGLFLHPYVVYGRSEGSGHSGHILSCQPRVTVTSCFVCKVVMDL